MGCMRKLAYSDFSNKVSGQSNWKSGVAIKRNGKTAGRIGSGVGAEGKRTLIQFETCLKFEMFIWQPSRKISRSQVCK